MRELVCGWSGETPQADPQALARRILTKSTSLRKNDIYRHAFRPRFLSGNPPDAWKLARALEDAHADIDVIRTFYYWITARAEPLLHAFACNEILRPQSGGNSVPRVADVVTTPKGSR